MAVCTALSGGVALKASGAGCVTALAARLAVGFAARLVDGGLQVVPQGLIHAFEVRRFAVEGVHADGPHEAAVLFVV